MTERQQTTAGTLGEKVSAAFDAAGIPRARWEGNKVAQEGVRIMLFGNGIEVDYVDPRSRDQHEAHVDQLLAILNEQFHQKDVELDGQIFKLEVRGKVYKLSDIHVYMYWVSEA